MTPIKRVVFESNNKMAQVSYRFSLGYEFSAIDLFSELQKIATENNTSIDGLYLTPITEVGYGGDTNMYLETYVRRPMTAEEKLIRQNQNKDLIEHTKKQIELFNAQLVRLQKEFKE